MDETRLAKGSPLSIYSNEIRQTPILPAGGIVRVTASTTRSITQSRGLTRSWAQDLSSRDLEWSLRRRQRTAQARLSASLSTQVSDRSPVWSGCVWWETPGRLFAQAFWGGGACEGRFGGIVGAFSCRRMRTLANTAGLRILETNLNSDSCQPRQQFFSKSNNWLRSDLFHPDGNHESSRGSNW